MPTGQIRLNTGSVLDVAVNWEANPNCRDLQCEWKEIKPC